MLGISAIYFWLCFALIGLAHITGPHRHDPPYELSVILKGGYWLVLPTDSSRRGPAETQPFRGFAARRPAGLPRSSVLQSRYFWGLVRKINMSKKLAAIAVCLIAGASPAFAQSATCVEPVVPAMVDGTTVAQPELVAAIAQVKEVISKSDIYQTCIASDLDAKKKAATAANTPFENQLQQIALAKVAANQAAKDKAANDINTNIAAFKNKPK